MRPEPVRGGTISRVAALLDAGQVVSVQLEPGDGTRYDLVIVPLWSQHVDAYALGYASESLRECLLILNAQSASNARGATIRRNGYYRVLNECGAWESLWSTTFLQWWFECNLWPRIEAIRGVRFAVAGEQLHEGDVVTIVDGVARRVGREQDEPQLDDDDAIACPKGDPECLGRDVESLVWCESPPGWPYEAPTSEGESDAAPA
jgi:hypothetical protein